MKEKKLCIRCNAELESIPQENFVYPSFEEEGYRGSKAEYRCPECLTYYCVSTLDDENETQEEEVNYIEYTISKEHCYGQCIECGHPVGWDSDFMRSEVWGDVDTEEKDEYGCSKDDALVSYASCPNCGAYIEIVEPKPSEIKAKS